MRNATLRMRLIRSIFGLLVLPLIARSVAARGDDTCTDEQKKQRIGVIDRVDYNDQKARLEIRFSKKIAKQDLDRAPKGTWVLVDIMQSAIERPVYVIRDPERSDHRPAEANEEFATVYLYLSQRLKPVHAYRLFQSSMTFKGCKPDDPLEAKVKAKEAAAPNPAQSPAPAPKSEKGNFFNRSKSKGKEDSNFYLNGQIEGAKGSDTQFSADIKIDQPFDTRTFFDEIGPFFNLKASTANDADANSTSFGAKLRHSYNISRRADPNTHEFIEPDRRVLTGLVFDLLPGFEADRRYKNVNAVLGTKLYLIPRVIGKANITYFQPYLGYEIGRNLKSPVAEAEHRGISRGMVGGSLYVNLFPKQINGASLQVDYVRRFLFRREIGFTENDDKALVPVAIGKGPRDDFKATFGLDFSDFAGLTFSYEYGRLPPIFSLVDHKFSFGLVYKFQNKFKGK